MNTARPVRGKRQRTPRKKREKKTEWRKRQLLGWNRYWKAPEVISAPGGTFQKIIAQYVVGAIQNIQKKKITVCDIGSAKGWMAAKISKLIPQAEVITVDAADLVPIQYLPKLKPGYRHARALAEKLPFLSKSVDALVSNFTLEYTNREAFMQEMRRTLKDDGKAILVLHHPKSGFVRVAEAEAMDSKRTIALYKQLFLYCKTSDPKHYDMGIEIVESMKAIDREPFYAGLAAAKRGEPEFRELVLNKTSYAIEEERQKYLQTNYLIRNKRKLFRDERHARAYFESHGFEVELVRTIKSPKQYLEGRGYRVITAAEKGEPLGYFVVLKKKAKK